MTLNNCQRVCKSYVPKESDLYILSNLGCVIVPQRNQSIEQQFNGAPGEKCPNWQVLSIDSNFVSSTIIRWQR